MNLEELIYKRFSGWEELTKHLAKYSGLPAVFSPDAPGDEQVGWGEKPRYPRVEYSFDLQANEERRSNGTLTVSLLCQNTADVAPEAIEPEIKKCLRDVLIKPKDSAPYCFTWARTDAFSLQDKKDNLIIGCDIRFDILEYPNQETTDPDPIMAVNKYMKELWLESLVLGYDNMEEITEATKERPVIYCRLTAIDKEQETNTVAWMDGKIAVHILCPDAETRLKMATATANRLSLDGEIILLDHSPMFIKRLQANYKSDYLKDGQIFVTGHYGLLRYKAKPHSMEAAHVKYK